LTTRIALGIEYNGASFSGWQRQLSPELPTVQGCLEQALSRIADRPVALSCAGRTDAGVHASGQVVHFDAAIDRGEKAWVMGANSLLPLQVRVQWARCVPDRFHARHSALSRRYRYVIYDEPVKPAVLVQQITHVRQPLDTELMHIAAQHLLGEHDFSAFRGSACQSRTAMRFLSAISVYRQHRFIVIDVEANAFLLHMVRNIAGTLMVVGCGQRPPQWVAEVLSSRDRRQAGNTAKPDGLYLVKVAYPQTFGLPLQRIGPCFL